MPPFSSPNVLVLYTFLNYYSARACASIKRLIHLGEFVI